jgi:hypothetical protein
MAINVSIYSNANASSKTVSFDFVGDVLAATHETPFSPTNASSVEYYFRVTTGASQDDNARYPARVVRSLSELILNGAKQRKVNTANAYSDIKSMIVDYTYDYIHGHEANLYGSGVTEQRPMKF